MSETYSFLLKENKELISQFEIKVRKLCKQNNIDLEKSIAFFDVKLSDTIVGTIKDAFNSIRSNQSGGLNLIFFNDLNKVEIPFRLFVSFKNNIIYIDFDSFLLSDNNGIENKKYIRKIIKSFSKEFNPLIIKEGYFESVSCEEEAISLGILNNE